MKVIRRIHIVPLLLAVFGIGSALGQERPPLPFEVDGPQQPQLGQNTFGRPIQLRGIHNESVATPDFGDIQLPPDLIGPPRYYIYIRYYACRPWFVHPYLGTDLAQTDLFTNIQTNNDEWPGRGLPLEELLKVNPEVGEPLVEIVDEGLQDENNPIARQCWLDEQQVEIQNGARAGVNLGLVRDIHHAPWYGLYCLRVRICVPIVTTLPGRVWNYWPKWRYRVHQRYCWRTWWHYCWTQVATPVGLQWRIYPWRPMCVPCVFWHRAGPDWIINVCNVNRFRHWCFYGFRYYCTFYGNVVFRNPSPSIAALLPGYQPPGGVISTDWIRPWPYPRVRYWPFRPYCTRWYWFRPLPWINYRYLPPVINVAVAIPNAQNGSGFVEVSPTPEQVEAGLDQFPLEPPKLNAEGNFEDQAQIDSFFDIFVNVGECRYRALEEPNGDNNGDGTVGSSDSNRAIRLTERLENEPVDLGDTGLELPREP